MKKIALGVMAALTLIVAGCGKQTSTQEIPPADRFFANVGVARGMIKNAKLKIDYKTIINIDSETMETKLKFDGRIEQYPTKMMGDMSIGMNLSGETKRDNETSEDEKYKFFLDKKGSYMKADGRWEKLTGANEISGFDEKSMGDQGFGPNINPKNDTWMKAVKLSREGSNYIAEFKLSGSEAEDFLKIKDMTEKVDTGLKLKSLNYRLTYDSKTYRPKESYLKLNYAYDKSKAKASEVLTTDISYSQEMTMEYSDFNKEAIKAPDVSGAGTKSTRDDNFDSKSRKKEKTDSDKKTDKAAFIVGRRYY